MTLQEIAAKVTGQDKALSDLREQVSTLQGNIETRNTELEQANTELENLRTSNQEQATRIQELEASLQERDTRIQELEAAAENTAQQVEEAASSRAVEIVASAGADPAPAQTETVSTTADSSELWAQYNKLQSPKERTEFYNKHRSQLRPW